MTVRNNSKLYMGEKNVWERFIISVHENAILIIGKKCTFGRDTIIWSAPYTRIIIGEDCMFSTDVVVHSNDGHAIFDIKTGETINASEEICKSRKVIIGNHVWVGRRCLILYNAEIGDGSIIGAGSLVKKKIPNNVIAVGTPARVTRKDVAWSREPVSTNILDCGEEYINLTNE